MARIRTIKPEFPQSESMGRVSRDARLLFVLLWTIADDSGRLRGNSRMLASLLFPYDDDAPGLIDKWMDELDREHCIDRYEVDGNRYVQIAKWLNHQKIDRPSESKIPPFDESSRVLANDRESSSLDLRIKDQGSKDRGAKEQDAQSASAKRAAVLVKHADLVAEGLSEQTAAELLASRKRHRADLTPRAWEGIKREFALAGLTLEQGVGYMLTRGWRSFEAKWLDKQQGNGNGPQRQSIHEQRAAVLAGLTGRSRPKQPEQQGLTIDGGFAERVD